MHSRWHIDTPPPRDVTDGVGLGPSIGLALCLALPSTATFAKYTQAFAGRAAVVPVVAAYVAATIAAVLVLVRFVRPWALAKIGPRSTRLAEFATLVFVIVSFIVLYPLANSGRLGGGGDRDEALDLAAAALMHGRFPYYERTYLGGPISPLPGAVVLALPFALAGNSAYQNLFWMLALYVALKATLSDARLAMLALWSAIGLSPMVMRDLVTGSDMLCNSIYVLLFLLVLLHSVRRDGPAWARGTSAVLLGIGLSSRLNFALLFPLVFAAIGQRAGWKTAIKLTTITLAAFLLITLPFYLYDPPRFSPLHTTGKLEQFSGVLPHAQVIIPLLAGLAAMALALAGQRVRGTDSVFLRNCAVVQAIPVVAGVILTSVQAGAADFSFASYGLGLLFFGLLAAWLKMAQPRETPLPNAA